jgi:hypothetical protein
MSFSLANPRVEGGSEGSAFPFGGLLEGPIVDAAADNNDESNPELEPFLCWRMDPELSFSDWKLTVKNSEDGSTKTYHVHKNMLAVGPWKSDYFSTVFRNPQLSEHEDSTSLIELTELECQAMPLLLDIMYSHDLDITDSLSLENAVPLRSLAEYFGVTLLSKEVMSFLNKKVSPVSSNLAALIKHASLLGDEVVLSMAVATCKDYLTTDGGLAPSAAQDNANAVIDFLKRRDFEDYSDEQACQALSQDLLSAQSPCTFSINADIS